MVNKGIYQIAKNYSELNDIRREVIQFFDQLIASTSNTDEKIFYTQLKESSLTQLSATASPWFRSFLVFDPRPLLERTQEPLLGIWGSKDLQVPGKENYAAMSDALRLAKNNHYDLQILNGLNHLFQNCSTGSPSEYDKLEETFSVEALNIMSEWILRETTKNLATKNRHLNRLTLFILNYLFFELF
jgi:hypothetical protein